MLGYTPGEDDLQGVLHYRSKYQPHVPRMNRWAQTYPVPKLKRNLPQVKMREFQSKSIDLA